METHECRECSDKSCQDLVDGHTGRFMFTKEGSIYELDTPIKQCKIKIFRALYNDKIVNKRQQKSPISP